MHALRRLGKKEPAKREEKRKAQWFTTGGEKPRDKGEVDYHCRGCRERRSGQSEPKSDLGG